MLSSSNRLSICTAVLSFTAEATHCSLSGDFGPSCCKVSKIVTKAFPFPSLSLSCSMEREEEGPWQHSDFIDNGGIVYLRDNMRCSREFSKKIASREFLQQRKGLTFKVHEKKITNSPASHILHNDLSNSCHKSKMLPYAVIIPTYIEF